MISAKTKLYGVIGHPVGHSLSPIFQNWILRKLEINAKYLAFNVSPGKIADALSGMKAFCISGLNVTVPHKEKVIPHLDELSNDVQLLGSANTIVNMNGRLLGYNTDITGFLKAVKQYESYFNDKNVLLIGAGGAARAIAFSLKRLGIACLIICDLTVEQTKPLVLKCHDDFGLERVEGLAINDARLVNIIHSCTVLINASPVGMRPHTDQSPLPQNVGIHRGMFVFDLIYNPDKTRLLQMAEQDGAIVQNGLDMLIFQGIASMEIWSGQNITLNNTDLDELRNLMIYEMGHNE